MVRADDDTAVMAPDDDVRADDDTAVTAPAEDDTAVIARAGNDGAAPHPDYGVSPASMTSTNSSADYDNGAAQVWK